MSQGAASRPGDPVEAIRLLQEKWNSNASFTARLERSFDDVGFTSDYVERAVASSRGVPKRTKDIKDNIWGMIELDWQTVRLIDAPLLQRLRGIKQLGLSYLTYPTAEHSRFAHSLGVGHVAGRFIAACDHRAGQYAKENEEEVSPFVGAERIRPLTKQEIVHAAILHDVGHMPFSHATEGVVTSLKDRFSCGDRSVDDFLFDVDDALGKSNLSEALSLAVVLSARFAQFYRHFVCDGLGSEDSLLRIASLIVSRAPDQRLVGVPDIISSHAVDADRVDYINRDAAACGIRVAVDVARLFLRSGLYQANQDALKALKKNPAAEEVHFFVSATGMDALEEITQARAALYQRVYYHPVTRAAEGLLSQTLHRLVINEPKSELADAFGLWALSDNVLLDRLMRSSTPEVVSSARRIYLRSLPKKACAFSALLAEMHMPINGMLPLLEPTDGTNLRKLVTSPALISLTHKRLTSDYSRQLEATIREEVANILGALNEVDREKFEPQDPLEQVLILGSRYMSAVIPDCYVLQNGQLLSSSEFTTTVEQGDATDIFKAVGFVMCDVDWRALVFIAARKIIFELSNALMPTVLPTQGPANDQQDDISPREDDPIHIMERTLLSLDGTMRRSNIPKSIVEPLMRRLEQNGYFDNCPLLGRRVPPERSDVVQIAASLKDYSGQRGWRVTAHSVGAFLDQFPESLRIPMVEALQKLRFFDNAEVRRAILKAAAGIAGADIVPLSPNSGTRVRYILETEAKGISSQKDWRFYRSLDEALANPSDRPLIFVDDNIASSTQARAQFLLWAGVPEAEWPPDCRREDGIFREPFSESRWELLKCRSIYLAVCAALPSAEAKLAALFKELHHSGFGGVLFDYSLDTIVDWPDDLKRFLMGVGEEILAWARFNARFSELDEEGESFCRNMAFGYGNVGGLTATASNVPSSTVTAIWCPGMHKGMPWMPLMLRQNRMRSLILA